MRPVDEWLRELRDSGALRGLPGEGAPLPPDPDADAGEAWAARHLVRGASARPLWAELRQDIADRTAASAARLRAHEAWLRGRSALLERLPGERIVEETRRTREVDRRVRDKLMTEVAEINALVRRHNLHATPSLQLATVTVDRLAAAARRAL